MFWLEKNSFAFSDRFFHFKGMITFHSHYGSPCSLSISLLETIPASTWTNLKHLAWYHLPIYMELLVATVEFMGVGLMWKVGGGVE